MPRVKWGFYLKARWENDFVIVLDFVCLCYFKDVAFGVIALQQVWSYLIEILEALLSQ